MGKLILIGGGSRSGKSRFALNWAESRASRRLFIATAQAFDAEMEARIARHRAERATRFDTIECPIEVPNAIRAAQADVVVVDCLSLWLNNLLGTDASDSEILERIDRLVAAVAESIGDVVVVSNEVGLGLVSEYELGRRFQDLTGWAHQRLAAAAAEIYLAAIGCVLRLKPEPIALVQPDPSGA